MADTQTAGGREDEVALVARARAGDADAFGELYERHVDRIYRYVGYRVTRDEEAEDLTEQVFLKAWEAMPRYEERGLPFAAWLYRLAHNLVIDHYRVRRADVPLSDVADGDVSAATTQADPQADILAKLEADELRRALRLLSDDQRQVVLLRFVEDLSHAEVAAIVGKSEGATRAIQHRALLALARLLKTPRGTDDSRVDGGPGRGPGRGAGSPGGGLLPGRVPGRAPGAPRGA